MRLTRLVPMALRSTAFAISLLLPAAAFAACGGVNLLDQIKADDPAAYATMKARADAVPNASGKFWRIEKPGVAPSHLFGTFHDTSAHELVDKNVWDALGQADGTWFELSLAEQERMQAEMAANPLAMIFDLQAPPLSTRLGPEGTAVIEAALADRGVPLEAAEQMRPWMLFALLGFPACQVLALGQGETALDDKLARYAVDREIPNAGLETFEEALAALGAMSPEDLSAFLIDLGDTRQIEEDLHRTRLDLYDAGDIQMIYEYGIWDAEQRGMEDARSVTDSFLDVVLVARNKAWMRHLVPAVESGTAFIGVGALHIPGEAGVVELLRAEGWTVTRLD